MKVFILNSYTSSELQTNRSNRASVYQLITRRCRYEVHTLQLSRVVKKHLGAGVQDLIALCHYVTTLVMEINKQLSPRSWKSHMIRAVENIMENMSSELSDIMIDTHLL